MGKKKKTAKKAAAKGQQNPTKTAIYNNVKKKYKDREDLKRTFESVKRINSLPTVYERIHPAKNRQPDRKSLDFDLDGARDIPNQVVYKDRITKKFSAADAYGETGSISFIRGEIGKDDKYLLKAVAKHNSKHFLKTRVGKKQLDTIYASQHYKAIRRDIESCGTAGADTNANSRKKSLAKKLQSTVQSRSCCKTTGLVILLTFLVIILTAGILDALIFSGVEIPVLSKLLTKSSKLDAAISEAKDPGILPFMPGHFAKPPSLVTEIAIIQLFCRVRITDLQTAMPKDKIVKQAVTDVQSHFAYVGLYSSSFKLSSFRRIHWNDWRFTVIVYANLQTINVLRWYGCPKYLSPKFETKFEDKMTNVFSETFALKKRLDPTITKEPYEVFSKMHLTTEFKLAIWGSYDSTEIVRPPVHIPDGYADCTGSPACPSTNRPVPADPTNAPANPIQAMANSTAATTNSTGTI